MPIILGASIACSTVFTCCFLYNNMPSKKQFEWIFKTGAFFTEEMISYLDDLNKISKEKVLNTEEKHKILVTSFNMLVENKENDKYWFPSSLFTKLKLEEDKIFESKNISFTKEEKLLALKHIEEKLKQEETKPLNKLRIVYDCMLEELNFQSEQNKTEIYRVLKKLKLTLQDILLKTSSYYEIAKLASTELKIQENLEEYQKS
jgi:hypothetical protein